MVYLSFSDSDFAGDRETRRSVYGYYVYFCGIPIAWKSKGMRSVALSTTEAEYIALSEVMKKIKFIIQLLKTMNMNVEMPITIYVDNVGAIWLSNNRASSERTKHIHIRTAFVKEDREEGKILIKFVKSEENDADINTKNTPNTTFKAHQVKIVWEKDEITGFLNTSINQQERCQEYAMAHSKRNLFCEVQTKLYSMKEIQASILMYKFNSRKNLI